MPDFFTLTVVFLTFLLAGAVKGVIGMGLPTVSIGLLGLLMTPAQAAAILVLPTLITNIWQSVAGRGFFTLLRRLWLLFAGIFVGSYISAVWLGSVNSPWASTALGVALVLYSALGLSNIHFTVPPQTEWWLAPIVGVLNGIVSAATGVFSLPALPYLHGLHLDRDDLVQALGLLFTVSTIALAAVLMHGGVLHYSAVGLSLVAVAASLLGMVLGQLVRDRVKPETFRLFFFIGLLLLGAHLALHGLL
ncbi:MAG TPA: sulfite exporter TauE/SafE family protein [Pseudolabrys sp.]|nr:sulfite exporter TauE/SafE family protein [Pseudolabrys sp.]